MHTIMHASACLECGVQNFLDKSQEIKNLWSCPLHPHYKKKKKSFDDDGQELFPCAICTKYKFC